MDEKYRILQPFRPQKGSWVQWDVAELLVVKCYAVERYYSRVHELQVLTAIERVRQEEGQPDRFEYHLSVTGARWPQFKVYRCSDQMAKLALEQFGFTDYTEDNHVPGGKGRNYWRPIAENQDPSCHCFETEPKIIEDKGDYIWRHAPGK